MSLRGRRVLLAAGSALLIGTPGHAAEICGPAVVCVDPAFVGDTLAAYGVDTGVGSGGEGVVCKYIKYTQGPPPGWNGGYGPPYTFDRTYDWGERYPDPEYWQVRDCVLLCVTASSLQLVCVTPPSTLRGPIGSGALTGV